MVQHKPTARVINLEIAREISELETGWASALQVAFDVGGTDDPEYRRQVRATISALVRTGAIERLFARHREIPLEIIYLDQAKLEAAVEALELQVSA